VAAGDGATIQVVHGDGGSLNQRLVHPVSLVQKRRQDIIKLFMGSSGLGRWRRTHGDSPIYRAESFLIVAYMVSS
jgi:hypothetical protein